MPEGKEGDKKDETTAVEPEKKDDTPSVEDENKESTIAKPENDNKLEEEEKASEEIIALPEYKYEHTYVSIEKGSLTNEEQIINQEKLLVGF